MPSIAISSAHGSRIRGAAAYIDEVDESSRVVERLAELWRKAGVTVAVFHDDTSTTQSANLAAIVTWHNKQNRDYDISVHFNAYHTTSAPRGTETLYVTQKTLATDVSSAIATAGSFTDRGAKKRTDLRFLNGTSKPAILIELCFVDSAADCQLYSENLEGICIAIA